MGDDTTKTVRVRASAIVVRGDQLLTVRAVDPVTGERYRFLPGGGIEPGELAEGAAERETLEETGFAVRATPSSVVREYTFDWAGHPVACRTTFCRATLVDPNAPAIHVDDADYLRGVEWVSLDQVDEAFAYHAVVREAVEAVLNDPVQE